MKSIVMLSLGLTLASPFAAKAQPLPRGTTAPAATGLPQRDNGREGAASAVLLADPAASSSAPKGFDPLGQKPPRPERAIGPDLVAYIFAPVGGIVGPITEGLHAFDATLAPVNAILFPLTGPHAIAPAAPPDNTAVPPVLEALPSVRPLRK